MHIKKYIQHFGILSAILLTTACNNDFIPKDENTPNEDNGSIPVRTVSARVKAFQIEGEDASLSGENSVTDLQACLFEEGVLTHIYTQLSQKDDQYTLQTDKEAGHLYFVGNTASQLDLQALKEQGLTEEEWLKTTLEYAKKDAQASEFFSGMLDLGKNNESTLHTDLERGSARFDLSLPANSSLQVKGITFTQIAQRTFLFPQNPVASPENTERTDKRVDFSETLNASTQGVAYLYEQTGTDVKAQVNVVKKGKETTVESSLPSTLKRNTVYTLSLSEDSVSGSVKLQVIEWENGGDHNLSSEAGALKVDTQASTLPENVTVNDEKNRIVLPYTATELTLAIDCDDQLEFIPDPMPLTVQTLGGSSAETMEKNLFRIQKDRWRLGVPGEEIKLRFHRKGLQQTYPDDFLTVVLTENPTRMEGLLNYNDSYEFHFDRYIDNELGVLTLPESKKLTVEYENGEGHWIKLAAREDNSRSFRILGGWKPNDPTANGRVQKATLVICNNDGTEREEYTVSRRNWGLPVTYLNGVWWCKYNAMGDSKDFNNQILSSNDPAAKAGKTVFDYLRDCTPEEFFKLWKWQYQGKTTQGMQVIDDNGVAKLEGYSTSSVHINKLEPTAMAPDGYELPSMENFERVLNSTSGTIWLMWDGSHTTAWNGNTTIQRRQRRRNDVTVGSVEMTDLIYIQMYNQAEQQYEPLVWYGSGAQWNDSGIKHGHYNAMLWATYSPDNGQGWYYVGTMGGLYPSKNGAGSNDSRLLRFKKSDVEYIYE